jgi:arylsulfatase A-like enzyme
MRGGQKISALTEFVDIYPTLCELTHLPTPESLEGLSLAPLMQDPGTPWKTAAFSRYRNGDSVRTERYRYTEWVDDSGSQYARMLYDHETDPNENTNIAENPENAEIVGQLSSLLKKGWKAALPD